MKADPIHIAGERRVLIVEPDADGHHAFWLVLIVLAFQRAGWRVSVLGPVDDSRVRAQADLRGLAWESVDWGVADGGVETPRAFVRACMAEAERRGAARLFFAFLDKQFEGLLELDQTERRGWDGRVSGVWFPPYARASGWRACGWATRWATPR